MYMCMYIYTNVFHENYVFVKHHSYLVSEIKLFQLHALNSPHYIYNLFTIKYILSGPPNLMSIYILQIHLLIDFSDNIPQDPLKLQ